MSPSLARRLFASVLLAVSTAAVAAGPTLVWRGDVTTARSMADGLAHAWQHQGHGHVVLQPFNTISGIDAVMHGSADVGGSARPAYLRRDGESGLTFTPVAWDALVMIANPHNPVHNLTLKQLHDIYYGKIKYWSQVGGPHAPIHLYSVASPTDGVEYSLRRLLFGRGVQPVAAPRLYINVEKLEEGVSLDRLGLGVTTLSGVAHNRKVKVLSIDGHRPSRSSVTSGSYPLYTPLYLVTNPDDRKHATATAFVKFARSPAGERVLRRQGLVPYAAAPKLAQADGTRMAQIADEVGRIHHNGPTAAPQATYTSRAASAPTSPLTLEARQRLQKQRDREAAERKRRGHDDAHR
jgi:phosphate transport system substrate-binding protein